MKRIFILMTILLSDIFVYSQSVEVSAFQSDLFVGLPNQLRVQTRIKHDSLSFSSTNGKIVRPESGGIYYIPATIGKGRVFTKAFRKGKVIAIDSSDFAITRSQIFCHIKANRVGRTSLNYLKTMGGILFSMQMNSTHWVSYKIESYRFTVIRAGVIVGSLLEQSHLYSESMKLLLEELKPRDVILISDISIAKKDLEIFMPITSSFEIE